MSKQNILQCCDIVKTFADGKETVCVLNKVNLLITQGEQIAIMGRSGSGKTTLLQLLAGLDTPSSGRVLFQNQDFQVISDAKKAQLRNRSMGFIYQFHHLLPEFTAYENVAMPLLIRELPKAEVKERVLYWLNAVGLENRKSHKPQALSGGERQRIAIARALVSEPVCVLADEPTGNLDADNANVSLELMKKLNRQSNTTFIIVTHDRDLAAQMDRTYLIKEGQLHLSE